MKGTLAAAAAAGVPVLEFGPSELAARQPQYAGLGPDDMAVWDPGAGICYPERIIAAQAGAARGLGAEIYPHTMVTGIQVTPGGVTVHTPTVDFRASQAVVATGAWLGTLVPGLPLVPRRTPLYWFRPRDPGSEDFTLGKFPAFIWRRSDGEGLWGHGSDEDLLARIVTGERPYCQTSFLNPGRFRPDASRNGVGGRPGCAG